MGKLIVRRFGPIESAEFRLSPLTVFIGPQASGKSTLSKLAYYFLLVRDELAALILDEAGKDRLPTPVGFSHTVEKKLRNRFVEFMGTTPQRSDLEVSFDYDGGARLSICLDTVRHKYITPHFDEQTKSKLYSLVQQARDMGHAIGEQSTAFSALGRIAHDKHAQRMRDMVRSQCRNIFGFENDLLFIPAGRSLLSVLAPQLQTLHPHKLDYGMRQFIETVSLSNSVFEQSMEDLVRSRRVLSEEPIRLRTVRNAQEWVRGILKGEFRHDREGGKLFIADRTFTKMSFASSGQQEVVWILLSLFLLVLENSRVQVVIEEPEAHLYPQAQHQLLRFIAYVYRKTGCHFMITTHSPYILGSLNNLVLAHSAAGAEAHGAIDAVVPKDFWVPRDEVQGFFVADGTIRSIWDGPSGALRWEFLDSAADEINSEYERLAEEMRQRGQ